MFFGDNAFSMIDRVKRVHFFSTLFLSKNGIMTERGVGRYPYLHRQTMLFFYFISMLFSFITLRVCLSFSSFLSFAVLERHLSLVASPVESLAGSGLGLSDWELFEENPVF